MPTRTKTDTVSFNASPLVLAWCESGKRNPEANSKWVRINCTLDNLGFFRKGNNDNKPSPKKNEVVEEYVE